MKQLSLTGHDYRQCDVILYRGWTLLDCASCFVWYVIFIDYFCHSIIGVEIWKAVVLKLLIYSLYFFIFLFHKNGNQ